MLPSAALRKTFGDIDIYLFDQLLRGRFDSRGRVLDAGCGDGRNLHYLLSAGFDCFGVDEDPRTIEQMRQRAARVSSQVPLTQFIVGEIGALPCKDRSMDVVICSAVLHFAADASHFGRMVTDLWRVSRPAGCYSLGSLPPSVSNASWAITQAGVSDCPTGVIALLSTRRCCLTGPLAWTGVCSIPSRRPTFSSSAA